MTSPSPNSPPETLEERLSRRGRDYFALMKCPIDGTAVHPAGNEVICVQEHHHYSRAGIIMMATDEELSGFNQAAEQRLQERTAAGWQEPDEEGFKRLPQTPLEGWPPAYWQKRAYVTAELWRWLEEKRRAAGQLPIADLGTVADLTGTMGWLGYGADVAGYTTLVVGQDATSLGLDAFPYARYPRIQARLDDPPLTAGQYDVVLYSFCLPLLDDIPVALANGAALLKPGGAVVVLLSKARADGLDLVAAAEEGLAQAGLDVRRRAVGGMGGRVKKLVTRLKGGPDVPPLIIGSRA